MPRFIVESHRKATKQTTRWLSGVVLEAAGCKVLVEANRDRKRIDILVQGPQARRRAALNVVLTDLEYVHRLNPGLEERACVPLQDNPEASAGYDHLLQHEEDPEFGPDYKIKPEGATRSYTVKELLDGVRRERTTGDRQPAIATSVSPPLARADSDWNRFAIACGLAAVVLAIVVWLLPSLQLKALLFGLSAIGIGVAILVRGLNPQFFYRRMIGRVIAAGFLFGPLAFSVEILAAVDPDSWWARFDGSASDWFYPAWALIVVALVAGDVLLGRNRT